MQRQTMGLWLDSKLSWLFNPPKNQLRWKLIVIDITQWALKSPDLFLLYTTIFYAGTDDQCPRFLIKPPLHSLSNYDSYPSSCILTGFRGLQVPCRYSVQCQGFAETSLLDFDSELPRGHHYKKPFGCTHMPHRECKPDEVAMKIYFQNWESS